MNAKRSVSGFVDYVVHDLLGHVPGVMARAMFGGHGLYRDGIIFGIIVDNELYFKVDESNRGEYESRGSHPFVFEGNHGRRTTMSYWLVPSEVTDNSTALASWIDASLEASKRAKAGKPPKTAESVKKPVTVKKPWYAGSDSAGVPNLYRKNHLDKDDERLGLFECLRDQHAINRVLYPGCYAHVTPALVFPDVIFNDTYAKLEKFYGSEDVRRFIVEKKSYSENPVYRYVRGDFTEPLPLQDGSFDLLISQYAGFVSRHCKRYLKPGGILVANNSHADAGLASVDPDFCFIAVVHKRGAAHGGTYSYSTSGLAVYFIPKNDQPVTPELLESRGKGIGYTKTAAHYVFEKRHTPNRYVKLGEGAHHVSWYT